MIHQTDIEKLERFSRGLSDAEEEKYIYSLFSEKEGNEEFKEYILKKFNVYFENNTKESYNLSYLLDRIHHTINNNENSKKQTALKRIYKWYSVAAAVLLLPLLIAGGIWFTSPGRSNKVIAEAPVTSTLFAPMGSRISFSLPDGTNGWLNSGSSIEYNIPFKANRQIAVTGEAWLDVAHDANHPFEITAGNSKVKVLGTKLNLNAYPETEYIEVVLEQGKIEFSVPGQASAIEMKPGERLVLSEGTIKINETEAAKYGAWKEGRLVFRGDPMIEVARRIQRWYNVEVELVDKELENYSIRGTFQDDSLEEVLQYLSMTSPISYQIKKRKMLADGEWQKQKVLLFQKK